MDMKSIIRCTGSSKGSRQSNNIHAKFGHNWQFMLVIGVLLQVIEMCNGHGRLIEPPGRSSAWRFGYEMPANYNDMELNCGGFGRHQRNGGRCGVCGDPWGKS